MKRRITAVLATLGMLGAVFIAAAPSAFADRTVDWQWTICNKPGGVQLEVAGKIVWFSGTNERYVEWEGLEYDSFGDQIHATESESFAMAVAGSWKQISDFVQNFDLPPSAYYIPYTPSENPGQGHYFTTRMYFPDGQCQSPVQLN